MRNSNKVCLLLFLLALGVCNISPNNSVCAQEEPVQVSPVQPEDVKIDEDELFDNAQKAIDRKDYQSAIVYLTNYINQKPKKYEAYKFRGDAFYALRQYVLAEQDYQTAISIKAANDKFLTGTKVIGAMVLGADKQEQLQNPELGNLYARLMYAQKALNNPVYESALEKAYEYNSHIYLPRPKKEEIALINCPQKYGKMLNPQGVDSYIYGAIDDIENGYFSEAVYKTQYITSNYPKFYLGHYLTGVALAGLDKNNEAISAFEAALQYNPYDFESFASLGQIYYNEAEITFSAESAKKSIDYFNKALKYNPNCYMYYYYIGLNELQMGDFNLAISNFNRAIKFKSNDYNSIYYKLIALYIKGDYNAVVDGTTRMLYRHVSNYNSVLYLRALAYNKLGKYNLALADLEKIQNGVDDIYNYDVKVVSEKEKTLDSYIYYLKAKIMKAQGFGVKADMDKALQNPIIAKLSSVDKSLDSFVKDLNSSYISQENYNKYSSFYSNELPKLLESGLVVTLEDVDNQYDYIRTTFDNLGITFKYLNPNYKISTISNYAEKKFTVKLDTGVNTLEESEQSHHLLKQSTDQMDTLAGDSQTSIAQMLASQSLGSFAPVSVDKYSNAFETVDDTQDKELTKATAAAEEEEENKISQTQVSDSSNKMSEYSKETVATNELENNEVNESKLLKKDAPTDVEEKVVIVENNDSNTYKSEGVKITANDVANTVASVQNTPEVSKVESKDVKSDTKLEKTQNIQEESSVKTVDKTSEQEASETSGKESDDIAAQKSKVVEKHANVDLEEFDFVHKQAPAVDENSAEIVKFDSKDSGKSQADNTGSEVVQQGTEVSDSNIAVEESGENTEALNNKLVENKAVDKEPEPVVIPEDTSKIIKTDKKTPVPIVVVPALDEATSEKVDSKSVKRIVSTTQETSDEILEPQIDKKEAPVLELRPQVEQSVPAIVDDEFGNSIDAAEKDAANLKAKSDKKVKAKKNKKDKISKDEKQLENDLAVETVQEPKKSIFGNLIAKKEDKQVTESDSDIEKSSNLNEDNNIQNDLILSRDNAEILKTQKKEKSKSKNKENIQNQTSQEGLISSFVQSTFGSPNAVEFDSADNINNSVTENEKNIVDSCSGDKNKKEKLKKEKKVNNTEAAINETFETSESVNDDKKFSWKGFWARFKRAGNSEKSETSTDFENEDITTESGLLNNDELQENLINTDIPVKTKKEKIKKKEKNISSEVSSESVSQDNQDSKKKKKLKNKKDVESVTETSAPDDKKVSEKKNKKTKNKDSENKNEIKEEHPAKGLKIPHLRGNSKDQNNEESLQLAKPKVHVPTAKDKFEVYTKDNKQRTIIKQMNK